MGKRRLLRRPFRISGNTRATSSGLGGSSAHNDMIRFSAHQICDHFVATFHKARVLCILHGMHCRARLCLPSVFRTDGAWSWVVKYGGSLCKVSVYKGPILSVEAITHQQAQQATPVLLHFPQTNFTSTSPLLPQCTEVEALVREEVINYTCNNHQRHAIYIPRPLFASLFPSKVGVYLLGKKPVPVLAHQLGLAK